MDVRTDGTLIRGTRSINHEAPFRLWRRIIPDEGSGETVGGDASSGPPRRN